MAASPLRKAGQRIWTQLKCRCASCMSCRQADSHCASSAVGVVNLPLDKCRSKHMMIPLLVGVPDGAVTKFQPTCTLQPQPSDAARCRVTFCSSLPTACPVWRQQVHGVPHPGVPYNGQPAPAPAPAPVTKPARKFGCCSCTRKTCIVIGIVAVGRGFRVPMP